MATQIETICAAPDNSIQSLFWLQNGFLCAQRTVRAVSPYCCHFTMQTHARDRRRKSIYPADAVGLKIKWKEKQKTRNRNKSESKRKEGKQFTFFFVMFSFWILRIHALSCAHAHTCNMRLKQIHIRDIRHSEIFLLADRTNPELISFPLLAACANTFACEFLHMRNPPTASEYIAVATVKETWKNKTIKNVRFSMLRCREKRRGGAAQAEQ